MALKMVEQGININVGK
jgi:hypothetical protein